MTRPRLAPVRSSSCRLDRPEGSERRPGSSPSTWSRRRRPRPTTPKCRRSCSKGAGADHMADRTPVRLVLLALAAISLIAGLWAGLIRLGWALPDGGSGLALAHGPLMVSTVLGVVIGLERAVALGRPWAYGAPLAAGLAGLALVLGLPQTVVAAF